VIARLGDRRVDLLLALAMVAALVVETTASVNAEGPWWANALCSALLAAGLLWRRVQPLVPLVTLLVAGLVFAIWLTPPRESVVMLFALVAAGYAVGRYGRPLDHRIAAGLAIAGSVAITLAMDERLGEAVFPIVVLAAAGVAGASLRNRTLLARELAARAEALETTRTAREQEAVLAERRRIARDLHDVVAHTVSVMVVQAGAARRTLERDPDLALDALAAVEATGRGALVEWRRLLGLLRPDAEAARAPQPGMAGLPDLIRRARAAGLPVEFAVEGEPATLPAGIDLAAYRVVQEALTNTLKHAGPARAKVQVHWSEGRLELVVTDTGRGPTDNDDEDTGHGLVGMRERVTMYGGELRYGPRGDGGFEVSAAFPRSA
jgi:signal transduction histidine kinase